DVATLVAQPSIVIATINDTQKLNEIRKSVQSNLQNTLPPLSKKAKTTIPSQTQTHTPLVLKILQKSSNSSLSLTNSPIILFTGNNTTSVGTRDITPLPNLDPSNGNQQLNPANYLELQLIISYSSDSESNLWLSSIEMQINYPINTLTTTNYLFQDTNTIAQSPTVTNQQSNKPQKRHILIKPID
ncbi:9284_t:CDS:1, partial [Gigaspora margarita]